MKNIAIIGAGQLGSRHLQALANLPDPVEIHVIDPFPESLKTAEKRYQQMSSPECESRVSYHAGIESLTTDIDVAIVATTANIRRRVVEQLLEKVAVRYFILEKVVFQSIADFDAVIELLDQHRALAWVNCPRRVYPFYRKLKQDLNNGTPVSMQVNGGNWRLVGNSIHMLDLFAFLTDRTDLSLFGEGLGYAPVENKRHGFIEFTGTMTGTTTRGDQLTLCSLPESEAPMIIEIVTTQERYLLSESEQKALCSSKSSQWKWDTIDLQLHFQSQLTDTVVQQIMDTGDCGLTTLEESYLLHKPMLEIFLLHAQKISGKKLERCDIT
jgi:predicted dehydrogenase